MGELLINCNIDKVLKVLPHVSEYVALTNIWATELSMSDLGFSCGNMG
jgi:hypothetical protein